MKDVKKKLPKQLAIDVPQELHHRLKLQAVHTETTIQSIVVRALEEHVPTKLEVITSNDNRRVG